MRYRFLMKLDVQDEKEFLDLVEDMQAVLQKRGVDGEILVPIDESSAEAETDGDDNPLLS